MYAPAAVGQLFQPIHLHACDDVSAALHGQRQVIHIKRIFRTDIAPGYAIAAVDAGFLLDALSVGSIDVEIDSEVETICLLANLTRPSVERLDFEKLSGFAMGFSGERGHGDLVVREQLGQMQGFGPDVLLKRFLIRYDRDIGIDERGAAEAAPLHDGDIRECQKIVEAERIGQRMPGCRGYLRQGIRKRADRPFAPALENADRFPRSCARNPRRHDRSTIARANHDDIVPRFALIPWFRQHDGLPPKALRLTPATGSVAT